MDKKSICEIHGPVIFKHRISKKNEWWVCHECLKEQWRRARKKRYEKDPTSVKQWQKDTRQLRKFFSVYLKMILYISDQTPK